MRNGRFIIAVVLALISLAGYFGYREMNPITGEAQHVAMSAEQEIALGLQAAPELAQQYGGLSGDARGRELVQAVGQRLVQRTRARETPYRWRFHLLDDDRTINAFALPGGQVFMTDALLRRLGGEAEVAGVLGHEIGHVVGRHGAEHLAKVQLLQGLGGAAVIAASDPDNPSSGYRNAALAQAVTSLLNMKYGRDDELESDRLGVRFMAEAGYDPRALLRVMDVLEKASSGGRRPEFLSTHPSPANRREEIKRAIAEIGGR
jgi:predicted Zn-dependent protease